MVAVRTLCILSLAGRLLAQIDDAPGQGCCADWHGMDLTYGFSFAVNYATMFEIPPGSKCDPEWDAIQARLFGGNWVQAETIACRIPDGTWARFRSRHVLFTNGTYADVSTTIYGNDTGITKCKLSTASYPPDDPTKWCVGPGDRYLGQVTYGSLPVERYARPNDLSLDDVVEFDVQNGCVPVAFLFAPNSESNVPSSLRINNWRIEAHAKLPNGTFDLPPECFLQAEQDLPAWGTNFALRNLPAWGTDFALV